MNSSAIGSLYLSHMHSVNQLTDKIVFKTQKKDFIYFISMSIVHSVFFFFKDLNESDALWNIKGEKRHFYLLFQQSFSLPFYALKIFKFHMLK